MKRRTVKTLKTSSGELNVSKLGLISAARRPERKRVFEHREEQDSLKVEIKGSDYGVPAGLDGDILEAIQTLFVLQGSPLERRIETTAYELLTLTRSGRGGKHYTRLRLGLDRLLHTTYTITSGWWDAERKHLKRNFVGFHLLERVQGREELSEQTQNIGEINKPLLSAAEPLFITLGEDLARNLRVGHLQHIDVRVLEQLSEPAHRTLYRFLQAHRLDDGALKDRIYFPLRVLCQHCGMATFGERLHHAHISISRAVEQLKIHAGLLEHRIEDGGDSEIHHFHFAKPLETRSEAVRLLTSNKIATGRAEQIAERYSLEAIARATTTARTLQDHATKQGGNQIRNLAGFTIRVLEQPGLYEDTTPPQPLTPRAALRKPKTSDEAPLEQNRAELERSLRILLKDKKREFSTLSDSDVRTLHSQLIKSRGKLQAEQSMLLQQ